MYRHLCARRVEIFIFQFAKPAAVHRIRIVRTKQFYVKIIRACADFFIRRKTEPDFSVRCLFMGQKIFRHSHDFRDARLIVRAEQGRSVGHDQSFSRIRRQFREISRAHHNIFFLIQNDILSVIIFYYPRIYALPRHCGRRIHMRNKADDRRIFASRGSRHRSIHITAFFVISDFFRSHFLQLFNQQTGKIMLFHGGGRRCAFFR